MNEASQQRHERIEYLLNHAPSPVPADAHLRAAFEILLEESVVQAQRLEALEKRLELLGKTAYAGDSHLDHRIRVLEGRPA